MATKNIEPGTPAYALHLVEECLKNKREELDLGNCGLTKIPEEILKLAPHLKKLNLGRMLRRGFEAENAYDYSPNKGEPNRFDAEDLESHKILAQLPHLSHIGCYNLYPIPFSIEGPNLPSIEWLDCSDAGILPEIAKKFPGLKFLGLNQVNAIGFGHGGFEALVNSLTENLEGIDLNNNHLEDNDLLYLNKLKKLRHISIDTNIIGNEGFKALCQNVNLETISFSGYFFDRSNRLDHNGLAEIHKLNKLESLDLSRQPIGDFGLKLLSEIQPIPRLKVLILGETDISDDGLKYISRINSLENLVLFKNNLGPKACKELGVNLGNLNRLSIAYNPIGDEGLEHLCKLESLETLYLTQCGISDLSSLEKLTKLKLLDLRNNQISKLKGIERLIELRRLDVSSNKILELEGMDKLGYLQHLDISGNQIQSLNGVKDLVQLSELCCNGNPIQSVPESIISLGNCIDALRTWWKETEDAHRTETNFWASLQVLGNGNVGKSSLLDALQFGKSAPGKSSTHGVVVKSLHYEGMPEGARITTWDFGGQEIYHRTHRLFRSPSAMEVLVFDTETEKLAAQNAQVRDRLNAQEMVLVHPISYWLKESDGSNPNNRVLVQNKMDRHPQQILASFAPDELLKQFGSFHQVSAISGFGISNFRKTIWEIAKQTQEFGMQMPSSWIRVRDFLISNLDLPANQSQKTIRREGLEELCIKHGVSVDALEILFSYLAHHGLIFTHPEYLEDIIILDLRWALEAIYLPLSREGSFFIQLLEQRGKVRALDLQKYLGPNYSEQEIWLLIEFMCSCGICFQYKDSNYLPRDKFSFLIFPRFLSDTMTETINYIWDSRIDLGQKWIISLSEYNYSDFLAFIVEFGHCNDVIHMWKFGFLLVKERDEYTLVKLSNDKMQIEIERRGRWTLLYVESIVNLIFKYFPGSSITNLNEIYRINPPSSTNSADKTLPSIVQKHIISIVISYAKESSRCIDEFKKQSRYLMDDYNLVIETDQDLTGRLDWESELEEIFKRADAFISFFCENYLDKDTKKYIHEKEIPLMIERKEREKVPLFGVKVEPIRLSKLYEDKFLLFRKGEVLPEQGNARKQFWSDFSEEFIEKKFLKLL